MQECVACDEGMFLYPQSAGEIYPPLLEKETLSNKYLFNYCVIDCPTVNMNMVNNPKLGRCEFLGYYCMYGNAEKGCMWSYLEYGNATGLNFRTKEGLDYTYGTPLGIEDDKF